MTYSYRLKGTCANEVSFTIDNGLISNVNFKGGCNGNLKAIALLVEGAEAKSISEKLKGNICGFKSTSCADQLARAIDDALSDASDTEVD